MSTNPINPINPINTVRQMPPRLEQQELAPQTNIWLQPLAAPSILGLYGFAGATFMVAAHMAHWFGTSQTDMVLWPFAAFFGGLAQFLAGMWAFKARDGVATAMHGTWGSFWMAFGILQILVGLEKLQFLQMAQRSRHWVSGSSFWQRSPGQAWPPRRANHQSSQLFLDSWPEVQPLRPSLNWWA